MTQVEHPYRAAGLSAVVGFLLYLAYQPKAQDQVGPLAGPPTGPSPKGPLFPNIPHPFRPKAPDAPDVEAGKFIAGGPVSPFDGKTTVSVDLVQSLRMHNTGGMGPRGPGSGAGLCVFTSISHSARDQNEQRLWNLQKDMTKEQGGGYPSKVDAMIKKYGAGTQYVQHTGGDPTFIELALKTGRLPAVTYDGRDGVFYKGQIAHMVNCAYLDQTQAAILDNNNPDKYLWMSREDFLSRWKGNGGGWVVVLLAARAMPAPHN